jgi:hypothetical protein
MPIVKSYFLLNGKIATEQVEIKEVEHIKCKVCNCWRLPTNFFNSAGRKMKCCGVCRARAKRYREKKKAEKGV